MRRFVIAVMLFVFTLTAFANNSQWISFQGNSTEPAVPELVQLETSGNGVTLTYEIPGMITSQVSVGNETFDNITLPGWGIFQDPGKPKVAAISRFLAVPKGADVSIEVLETNQITLQDYYLFPSQPPAYDSYDVPKPAFTIDREFYSQDVVYPAQIIRSSGVEIMRGLNMVYLTLTPIQYNPQKREITVNIQFKVRVNFSQSGEFFTEDRLRSPYFETVYKNTLLNYKDLEAEPVSPEVSSRDGGADMLIITTEALKPAADTLAAWKNLLGISTRIATVQTIGNNATQIRDYIQNAYDTWTPAPSFLLIIGDNDDVQSYYSTQGYMSHVTDLYFQKLDGSDYRPDIAIGRINVTTLDQALYRVRQIRQYEKDPITDPAFYNHSTHAAYFQHSGGGYAERRFAQTSEEMTQHLLNMGYNAERIFYTSPSVNPTNWNNGYYSNGEPIPSHLLRANGFQWNGSAADITNAVNAGTFLITHRDHGSTSGWADPQYTTTHAAALQNGDKLPVVFSLNCLTGKFNSSGIVFSEAWERNPNGGAVGIIAASETSMSGQNDGFAAGMIDAIWPGYVPSFPHNPDPSVTSHDPIYRMGMVMDQGKIRMSETWTSNNPPFDYDEYTYELFHWFGDPTMEIRTHAPQNFVVNHPPTIIMGTAAFNVNVDVDSADVFLTRNGVLLGTGFSENGMAQVSLFEPVTSPDLITMVVNKHNYIPYITELQPITASGPYLYCMSPVTTDLGLNENGVPEAGETVEMKLELTNLGIEQATNILATLSTSDTCVIIHNDSTTIAAVDTADTVVAGSFSIELKSDTPHLHRCFFELHMSADGGYDWDQTFMITVREGARIQLAADSLNFPNTFLNFSASLPLTITNTGPDTLFVTDVVADIPQYFSDETAFFVAPGMQKEMAFSFMPDTTEIYNGTFTIVNSDPSNFLQTFTVRGEGIFAPDIHADTDSLVQFAGITDSITIPVTIQNAGLGELSFNAQIAGWDPNNNLEGAGGSDAFGHMWIDSNEPNGPTFDWIEISNTGTPLALTGNNSVSEPIEIGFPFTFYGTEHNEIRVCTNGWLSFTTFSVAYNNFALPSNLAPRSLVAALWDDLIFQQDSKAYFENQGNKAVVQFNDVYRVSGEGPYTFEVVLYNNGNIVLQYLSMNNVVDDYTVGVQNQTADDGLNVAHNTSYVEDSLAVLISKHSWVGVSPMSGVISAQSTFDLDLTFLTHEFPEGDFWASLQIESNDPDEEMYIIPIHMIVSVTGIEDEKRVTVKEFALHQNSPNPFNPTTLISYQLPKAADVELTIFNMLGQKVKTLVSGKQQAQRYEIRWDGTNSHGVKVASGIYIYRLKAGKYMDTKKMILMK